MRLDPASAPRQIAHPTTDLPDAAGALHLAQSLNLLSVVGFLNREDDVNLNQLVTPLKQAAGIVAIALAAIAVLKLSGVVAVRFSLSDLAFVGVLCALVAK